MKSMKLALFFVLAVALVIPAFADVNENFDGASGSSYGIYDYNGFHLETGLFSSAGSSTCGSLPSNAVRIRNVTDAYLEYVGIDWNGKDGGVGDISFQYHSWSTTAAVYDVSVSINGGAYTIVGSQINDASCSYQTWSYTLNDATDNIKIKVQRVSGERLHVDDFSITDFGGGGGNETDAHVYAGGGGAQPTISSLVDTYGEQQIVHTFSLRDDGTGSDGLNTIITDVLISAGDGNTVDWTQFIAAAELSDFSNTWNGTISSGGILFSGAPLKTLVDGAPGEIFSLSIYLLTTLPFYADNEVLEFVVGPASFVTDGAGAGFDAADAVVESGNANNVVDIAATNIGITTQPSATQGVNVPIFFRAGFVDENNGIDEDWPAENITVSINTGIGNLSGTTTVLSSSGQSVFNDLLYDTPDTGVKLEVTSSSFAGPAVTDPFDVTIAPTIVIDAMPTCWDGDATVDAVPFVVHITIENWTDAAGLDANLKVYNGGANPYHYTADNGWSSSTSYAAKPVVTIDANGNYSGWLALKSKGLGSFVPRARLISNTSIQVTGVSYSGTLLDLDVAGGVVQDSDGSTNTTPGNIVLARNELGDILGSWIAEDNGYPQDGTISPYGWRLAMCDVCDDIVTFESWNPAEWPGNGAPEDSYTDEAFCAEGGATVEIDPDVFLPVELLNFTAISGDGIVELNWSTASENNTARFEIERNDVHVSNVEASNSASGATYSWNDTDIENELIYTYKLFSVDLTGNRELLATAEASPTAGPAAVTEYALHQNFPNPFNPETSIRFDLVEGGFVSLSVYNVLGQEVASLVSGNMTAGRHLVSFDGANLTSGLYLYRLEANDFAAQKKMVLMK